MPCLNYVVASLQCTQCRNYAMHICGISFLVWLAVFGVCIPKRDTHTHIYIYTRSENSVTIMCLALRRAGCLRCKILTNCLQFLRFYMVIILKNILYNGSLC